MRNGFLIVLAFFGLYAQSTGTFEKQLCSGFLPPNSMYIPDNALRVSGIAKDKFDQVLDRLNAIYAPIVAAHGGTLKIERRWSDGTVNAYADQVGRTWKIVMFGGMARHPSVTYDGFAAVACHELGHHLGGAPKGFDWASNEGAADYFSHLKCLRRLFLNDDNQKIVQGMNVDPIAARECKAEHNNQQDELICIRAAMAALALGGVLAEDTPNAHPKLDTPDLSEVTQTNDDHPAAQCRVDTLFQAALCKVPFATDLSDTDYKQGSCYSPDHAKGYRSRCWFKPN